MKSYRSQPGYAASYISSKEEPLLLLLWKLSLTRDLFICINNKQLMWADHRRPSWP